MYILYLVLYLREQVTWFHKKSIVVYIIAWTKSQKYNKLTLQYLNIEKLRLYIALIITKVN